MSRGQWILWSRAIGCDRGMFESWWILWAGVTRRNWFISWDFTGRYRKNVDYRHPRRTPARHRISPEPQPDTGPHRPRNQPPQDSTAPRHPRNQATQDSTKNLFGCKDAGGSERSGFFKGARGFVVPMDAGEVGQAGGWREAGECLRAGGCSGADGYSGFYWDNIEE